MSKPIVIRKRVKFPSRSVNKHSPVFAASDLRTELNWFFVNRPHVRWKKIDKIKFAFVEKYETDGCVQDLYWGWSLPLYNLYKLLYILGYKDMENKPTQHSHIYRYQDINMSVLNVIHAVLKDFKLPHLNSVSDGEDSDDELDNSSALPIILAQQPVPGVPPPSNPVFSNPNIVFPLPQNSNPTGGP